MGDERKTLRYIPSSARGTALKSMGLSRVPTPDGPATGEPSLLNGSGAANKPEAVMGMDRLGLVDCLALMSSVFVLTPFFPGFISCNRATSPLLT